MYYLLKTLNFVIKNIPRKAGYFFFRSIGSLMYLFGGKRKQTLGTNLRHVLGAQPQASLLKQVYRNYALYYYDLFCGNEKLIKDIDPSNFEQLKTSLTSAINQYGGIIVASMHYGNWDLAASFLSWIMPGKVTIVVEELSPPMYKWFTQTRASWGANIIASTDLKGMIRSLKQGNVLVLAADRDLNYTGFRMDFFNEKAHIPSGPAKLSLMCGVPVLYGVMARNADNPMKYNLIFDPECINTEKLSRTEENAEKISRALVNKYEGQLRSDPSQWCMLQKVWVEEDPQVK